MAQKRIPEHLQAWIDARKRHKLSHAQAQMARELGMNPRKLGKLDNHHQEPWKLPLPAFIEELYFKRFGKTFASDCVDAGIGDRCKCLMPELRQLAHDLRTDESSSSDYYDLH